MSVDLLVIGAGATGASIAMEAARRGLSVVLVEAGDIAIGTSSRSTKLLHGGVRYLELAFRRLDWRQLQLVREALAERGHWLEAVPFLARRLELLLPSDGLLQQAYYGLGLAVYDRLAGRAGIGSSRWLGRQAVQELLPELSAGHVGVAYGDGQFDDARLNLLMVRTAAHLGAEVFTRTEVVELLRQGDRLSGAVLHDQATGQRRRLEARVVLNATGIGADRIRQLAQPDLPPSLQVSRGVHLVLAADLCPGGTGLLIPSTDDGRVLFVLPFYGRTLVGTTDTPCGSAEAERPSEAEEHYLLDHVRRWFPGHGEPLVSSRWAGGRPLLLPTGEEESASGGTATVVREHRVETLPCGLISVMGGKWTTCRPMAFDGLQAVAQQLGVPLPVPSEQAAAVPIHGAAASGAATVAGLSRLRAELPQRLPCGETALLEHLLTGHGLETEAVLACAAGPQELEPLSPVIPLTAAEVRHAVRHEWARTADDLLARRCRLAFVDQAEAERLRPLVEALLDQELSSLRSSPTSHQKNP
ncbi:FAD-dependent oxidoreductase [Synechococcus sp. BSF8S]|uniref:glycerol-3-phosphate dehydrogenase/oxidase n=1 Tax=Synechococcales TaxID=1890424 RepID=UPI00162A1097|nr:MULTISPECIES: FAD-dependent oxidoreductase [unclassified Synechococcus]MBC1259852.1 FAD-dependent oxidoreductase [Synechococcus sp. BSF8S]MBC1262725.1 FAD-dependent oxidoreductase [Synechococcus sp. BSA11S]